MLRRYAPVLLGLSLLFSLIACDTTEPETEASGRIEGDITIGEQTENFQGQVYFAEGTDPETEKQGFGLYAEPNDNSDFAGSSAILFRFADRPGTATYDVVPPGEAEDDEFSGTLQIVQNGNALGTFDANDGTLTVETSTTERVEGQFRLEAQFGTAAVIEGTFDAGRGTDFSVPANR